MLSLQKKRSTIRSNPLPPSETSVNAQILTEREIQKGVVKALDEAKKGDEVWIGMFYLADRDIIDAIEDAAEREVDIRLVLDPNQNAFGQEKIGLPNLPIAAELHKLENEHITIRWYNTNKEQYHTKFIYVKGKKQSTVIGGSGNYTSRNLDDYNLEENLKLTAPSDSKTMAEVNDYFDRIWNNKNGTYTVDYEKYQDKLPAVKVCHVYPAENFSSDNILGFDFEKKGNLLLTT